MPTDGPASPSTPTSTADPPATARMDRGTVVVDREDPDGDRAVVVRRPAKTAAEWTVDGRGTVAEDNPSYPAEDPVVVVLFEDTLREVAPHYTGSRRLELGALYARGVPYYAFPESRLRPVDDRATHRLPVARLLPHPYHARGFRYEDNTEFVRELRQAGAPPTPPLVWAGDADRGRGPGTGTGTGPDSDSDSESETTTTASSGSDAGPGSGADVDIGDDENGTGTESGHEYEHGSGVAVDDEVVGDNWYTLLDGHKRVWASAVAGLDVVPCRVVRADWATAVRLWADRHLDTPSGYDGEARDRALARLQADFPERWAAIAGQAAPESGGDREPREGEEAAASG